MTNQTLPSNQSNFKSILKKSLYIFLAVIVLLLIVAIFLPKGISTSVSGEINAPKSYVFNLLNDQRNVGLWNDWVKSDEKIKLSFNEKNIGLGSGYSWESESFGKGAIKYTDIVPNEKIVAELIMNADDKSKYSQNLTEENGKTIMDWNFESNISYPSNIMAPILKYMMRKSYKKCIIHINTEVEKRKRGLYNSYQVKEESQNAKYFATARSVVKFENINQYYTQNLSAVYQKLQNNSLSSIGYPSALFYKYDETKQETDMAVAVQILNPLNVKDLTLESLAAQNAVIVDYIGDPGKTGNAHTAIDAYMKDRNLQQAIPVLEEYVTDPLKEKDMTKWLTKIYYFIKTTK